VSTEWSYTPAGYVSSIVSKRGATTFDSHSYTHDSVGNILTHVRNGATDSYQYDEIYRLTQATVNGTLYKYWYDLAGNRTQNQVGGNLVTYEYDSVNQCVTINGVAVVNDDNGCLTGFGNETYTWDVRGRLTKLVKGGATYEFQYDPMGMRSGKKVAGAWTYFLLDGDSVVKEITGGASVYTTQGPLIDQPLARNGRYFSVNHLGSTTTLTDGAGVVVQSYSYGPFGETSQSTGEANPFQYAGRENDGATGLYYNRARYYRPEWGRFISPDPIGFAGGLNHYSYASNNPLSLTDPQGLSPTRSDEYTQLEAIRSSGGAGRGGGAGSLSGVPVGGSNLPVIRGPVAIRPYERPVTAIQLYYPPNNGFSGKPDTITLQPGTLIVRWGGTGGTYAAPAGTQPWQLSMPYNRLDPLTRLPIETAVTYQVVQPISGVLAGPAAPWFGQPGGGVQYLLPDRVGVLLRNGSLTPWRDLLGF
jgi:RHS repeat-associated protein